MSDSPTLHSRWLLFFKVMIISFWNLLQYHSIVRWAIQAQWAEPLVYKKIDICVYSIYHNQVLNAMNATENKSYYMVGYLVISVNKKLHYLMFGWSIVSTVLILLYLTQHQVILQPYGVLFLYIGNKSTFVNTFYLDHVICYHCLILYILLLFKGDH